MSTSITTGMVKWDITFIMTPGGSSDKAGVMGIPAEVRLVVDGDLFMTLSP